MGMVAWFRLSGRQQAERAGSVHAGLVVRILTPRPLLLL
jgi:hypothetical protein